MRLGLTVIEPNDNPELPTFALPDLNSSGLAWIFALTRHSVGYQHVDDVQRGIHNHNQNNDITTADQLPPIAPLIEAMNEVDMINNNQDTNEAEMPK